MLSYIWSPLEKAGNGGGCGENAGVGFAAGIGRIIGNSAKIAGRIITVAGGTALTALAIKTFAASYISAATAAKLTTIAIAGGITSGAALTLPLMAIAGIVGLIALEGFLYR